jgi:hypothetical protein
MAVPAVAAYTAIGPPAGNRSLIQPATARLGVDLVRGQRDIPGAERGTVHRGTVHHGTVHHGAGVVQVLAHLMAPALQCLDLVPRPAELQQDRLGVLADPKPVATPHETSPATCKEARLPA